MFPGSVGTSVWEHPVYSLDQVNNCPAVECDPSRAKWTKAVM